jgi:hypothetical protein
VQLSQETLELWSASEARGLDKVSTGIPVLWSLESRQWVVASKDRSFPHLGQEPVEKYLEFYSQFVS